MAEDKVPPQRRSSADLDRLGPERRGQLLRDLSSKSDDLTVSAKIFSRISTPPDSQTDASVRSGQMEEDKVPPQRTSSADLDRLGTEEAASTSQKKEDDFGHGPASLDPRTIEELLRHMCSIDDKLEEQSEQLSRISVPPFKQSPEELARHLSLIGDEIPEPSNIFSRIFARPDSQTSSASSLSTFFPKIDWFNWKSKLFGRKPSPPDSQSSCAESLATLESDQSDLEPSLFGLNPSPQESQTEDDAGVIRLQGVRRLTRQTSSSTSSTSDFEDFLPSNRKEETVFCPEVSSESDQRSYRCPSAGVFRCSSFGLGFVVTKEAELQYRIVQWDEALLQSSGVTPAGPLYDIKCPEGALCELHLPHCEPQTEDLDVCVAHITDSGLSLIEPLRVTESHVEVQVHDLSLFGLVWKWIFKHRTVNGKVLLFRTPREQGGKIQVNVHLLCSNIPKDEVKRKQTLTTEFMDAPPKCTLDINQYYSVDCPCAEIIQPNRAVFLMDNDPDYSHLFQLRLPPESSTMSITVRQDRSSKETEVWRHQLDLSEPSRSRASPSTSSHSDPTELLKSVRLQFVDGVSDAVLNQLLDRLLQNEVLTSEEMDNANEKHGKKKARYVVDTVRLKGRQASSVLIEEYCKLDPRSELCKQLRTQF